jgi:putative PEP-CTERM system TPR-repeat lipoprotein
MKSSKILSFVILVITVFSACGFTVSNEERIARAEASMAEGEYREASIDLKTLLASDSENVKARLLLAEVSLGLGEIPEADKEIRAAADLGAPEEKVRPIFIEVLLAQGEFAQVLASLSEDSPELTEEQQFRYRGSALVGLGSLEEAEATYRDWLTIDPANADARIGLAQALASGGKTEQAADELERVLDADSINAGAWAALGRIQSRMGQYKEAVRSLSTAIENSKRETDFLMYLGNLYELGQAQINSQQVEEARLTVDRLTGASPGAPPTLFIAARLAYETADYAGAARALQGLLAVQPENPRMMTFLAQVQIQLGNEQQAYELLRRAVALSPQNVQARKMLAQIEMTRAEPFGALEALAPILDTSDLDVAGMRGQASLAGGRLDDAIENFRSALNQDPDNTQIKLSLAAAYSAAGQYDAALDLLESTEFGAGPDFSREQILLFTLRRSGQGDRADVVVDELKSAAPDSSIANMVIADFYSQSGNAELAKQYYVSALRLEPTNIEARIGLAEVEFGNGNFAESRRNIQEILKLEPGHALASLSLAEIELRVGDYVAAIAALNEARAIHADDNRIAVALAAAHSKSGNSQEALRAARNALQIGTPDVNTLRRVGLVFVEEGSLEEAIGAYSSALRLRPDSAVLHLELGNAYLIVERLELAKRALRRALQLEPLLIQAAAGLVLIDIKTQNLDEALAQVQEMKSKAPDSIGVMVLEGDVYSALGDHEQAMLAYARATENGASASAALKQFRARARAGYSDPDTALIQWLDKHPDDKRVLWSLAGHYVSAGRIDLAAQRYERLLELDPEQPLVMNNLAYAYQLTGQLERARDLAEKALSISPDSGRILDTLGWIYKRLGNYPKSIETLRRANELMPDNSNTSYHLAAALAAAGRKAEAIAILEPLLQQNVQMRESAEVESLYQELTSE